MIDRTPAYSAERLELHLPTKLAHDRMKSARAKVVGNDRNPALQAFHRGTSKFVAQQIIEIRLGLARVKIPNQHPANICDGIQATS